MLTYDQANAFHEGWGQTIFQSANEIATNQLIRTRMHDIQAQRDAEREWWDNKKKSIEAELMNEIDETPGEKANSKAPSRTSDDDTVLVEGGGPADKSGAGAKNKKKKGKA